MPTLIEKEVFTFDELSDSAKETAREWMRDLERTDFDTDFVFESCRTAADILGIELDTPRSIRWSGFGCQGDGASFVGSYSNAPNSPAKIREEFSTDTALHAIADRLTALQIGYRLTSGHFFHADIRQSGNYCHEMTMSLADLTDDQTGEGIEVNWRETEDRLLDLMRDFARWIYKSLEDEHDYRMSDEAIDECMDQYEFDENGDRI